MAGSAMAGLIVTANPATSAAYPVGTTFEGPGEVSETTNPVGPFSNTPVQFEGFNSGGSMITLTGTGSCGACLVFSYNLAFSAPTTITSISFTGDAFNGATFALFNSSFVVIDSLSESSGNVGSPITYTMPTPGVSGTLFTLRLYDNSNTWTFVKDISVNTTPEPATDSMMLMALGVIFFAQWRRLRREPNCASMTAS